MSTLIGILVDVSRSMKNSVGGKVEEKGGKWAKSIFKVVDELIKHDVSSSNQTFALAFGSHSHPETFDLLSTVGKANQEVKKEQDQIEDIKSRASKRDILDEALTILNRNGAPRVRYWGKMDVLCKVVDDTTAAAMLYYLQNSHDFTTAFVDECLPQECRELVGIVTEGAYFLGGLVDQFSGSSLQSRATEASVEVAFKKGKQLIAKTAETRRSKAAEFQLVDVSKVAIMSVHDASEILHATVGDQELTNKQVNVLLKTIEPYIYGETTPLMEAMHHSVKLFPTQNLPIIENYCSFSLMVSPMMEMTHHFKLCQTLESP